MMRFIRVAALVAPMILPSPAAAQLMDGNGHMDRPVAEAVRAQGALHIDGRLDEQAWAAAPVIAGFTQMDPDEGMPVSQRTEVRILFDDDALYIGARLFDDGPVTTRLGRRDMPLLDADWFGVVIDSYHGHQTGFVFDVNPSGVQRDAVKSMTPSGEEDDNSWDAVWDVATSIDEEGWTAEYRIPFSQLRFNQAQQQVWGIQLERLIGRRREYAVTTYTPKSQRGGIPAYGHLLGVQDVSAGERLELLPYVVARGEYVDPGTNPFRSDSEHAISGGLDARYRVTSDMTLNASINPDFGQVEVDPAVINLGVYETFFEEKRPFFIEGSDIFGFGGGNTGTLFYTRRVGRQPQLAPPSNRADVPAATTILGAAKLSGRTAGGWSLGMMEAVTAREEATFRTDEGDATMAVEPLTNYFVARARRDMRSGQSSIGSMVTMTHRDLGEPALEAALRSSAYAIGFDGRHEWANRSWVVYGNLALSHIRGTPEAMVAVQTASNHFFQRPDADHLDIDAGTTSMTGASALLALGRQAGEHWRGEVQVATTTPSYEINDLGFNYRTDRRDAQLTLHYLQQRPGSFWRNYTISGRARVEGNYANEMIANWFTLSTSWRHLSYWLIQTGITHSLRANDDRLTRGGPIAVRPANTNGYIYLSGDPRQNISWGMRLEGERTEFDGWYWGIGPEVVFKVSPRWNLTLTPQLSRAYVPAQYVGTIPDAGYEPTFGSQYVFAPLDQTTLAMETRLNYTFNPRLSLEVYAQPFISSGEYGDARYLAAPRTYTFEPYAGAVPDLDFNLRSLRGTAVLRWEWRPGSTLYAAWQQSRADYAPGVGDFEFGRDRRALFDAQPDNIFVLKASYWFTP